MREPLSEKARLVNRRSISATILASFLGLCPLPALAQDDATVSMARERFKEGVQYFDTKQYDKARAAFLQAYALKRHPAVLLNLAQSELRSGHEADAAQHFAQYLREHREATDTERDSAQAGLTAARAAVMELSVQVDEEGATILVDGNTEGISPLPGPLYVNPGPRTIAARKDGREISSQVNATAGQSGSATLRLRKPAAAPPPPPKRDDDDDDDDDDGDEPAPTPVVTTPTGEPSVETGTEVDVDTSTDGGRPSFFGWAADSPVAWAGGALTLVGAVGGVGFALAARQKYDDANSIADQIRTQAAKDMLSTTGLCLGPAPKNTEQYRDACNAYSDRVDAGDGMKTLAIVGGGLAAVGVVGTVIYYFVDTSSDEPDSAAASTRGQAFLTPWWSPEGHGVVVNGRF